MFVDYSLKTKKLQKCIKYKYENIVKIKYND